MSHNFDIRTILLGYVIMFASVCLRQWAKAWMINRLGDPSPKYEGRLTTDPRAHFDLMGTLIFPAVFMAFFQMPVVYGWGKRLFPRSEYFENPNKGEIIVSISGSVFNLLICLVVSIIGGFVVAKDPKAAILFEIIIAQNVLLAVFSMMPIPPLDGAYLLKNLFKMSEEAFAKYSQWSFFVLLIVLFSPLKIIIDIPLNLLVVNYLGILKTIANILA